MLRTSEQNYDPPDLRIERIKRNDRKASALVIPFFVSFL